MSDPDQKTVVLGVTGGIAAFKTASIASLLVQAGVRLEVVMTEAAQRFVQPLTFSAITHNSVHTDAFAPWSEGQTGHVRLANDADLLIVAPATANSIASLALGFADDLLGLVALATDASLIIAPAMEDHMFNHPATRGHLATLVERGATVIGPDRGRLASGAVGVGRMAAPESIVEAALALLKRTSSLQGRSVVVTAGGTQEPLDPVRYIGNRSSGTMGYALATAALAAGAKVTLISGPTKLDPPLAARVIAVNTALEMQHEVQVATSDADVLIMAAAVADFRPESRSGRKLKKQADQEFLDVRLIRNPDILASIDRPGLLKIGFAAETENLQENAARKLESKRLDIIVANDAEQTIGADTTSPTIITADGTVTVLPLMSKTQLATTIVEAAANMLHGKPLT